MPSKRSQAGFRCIWFVMLLWIFRKFVVSHIFFGFSKNWVFQKLGAIANFSINHWNHQESTYILTNKTACDRLEGKGIEVFLLCRISKYVNFSIKNDDFFFTLAQYKSVSYCSNLNDCLCVKWMSLSWIRSIRSWTFKKI